MNTIYKNSFFFPRQYIKYLKNLVVTNFEKANSVGYTEHCSNLIVEPLLGSIFLPLISADIFWYLLIFKIGKVYN